LITLDASCLIALFDKHNHHHSAAKDIIDFSRIHDLQIHTINLAEFLVGPVRTGQVAQTVAHLETMGVITCGPFPNEALRLAEIRHTTGLKLPDCCALLTAKANGFTLVTFDTTLAKAARQQGVTVIDQPTR